MIIRHPAQEGLNPLPPAKTELSLLHGLTEGRKNRAYHPHIFPVLQTEAGHLKRISSWLTMPAPAAEQQRLRQMTELFMFPGERSLTEISAIWWLPPQKTMAGHFSSLLW